MVKLPPTYGTVTNTMYFCNSYEKLTGKEFPHSSIQTRLLYELLVTSPDLALDTLDSKSAQDFDLPSVKTLSRITAKVIHVEDERFLRNVFNLLSDVRQKNFSC